MTSCARLGRDDRRSSTARRSRSLPAPPRRDPAFRRGQASAPTSNRYRRKASIASFSWTKRTKGPLCRVMPAGSVPCQSLFDKYTERGAVQYGKTSNCQILMLPKIKQMNCQTWAERGVLHTPVFVLAYFTSYVLVVIQRVHWEGRTPPSASPSSKIACRTKDPYHRPAQLLLATPVPQNPGCPSSSSANGPAPRHRPKQLLLFFRSKPMFGPLPRFLSFGRPIPSQPSRTIRAVPPVVLPVERRPPPAERARRRVHVQRIRNPPEEIVDGVRCGQSDRSRGRNVPLALAAMILVVLGDPRKLGPAIGTRISGAHLIISLYCLISRCCVYSGARP